MKRDTCPLCSGTGFAINEDIQHPKPPMPYNEIPDGTPICGLCIGRGRITKERERLLIDFLTGHFPLLQAQDDPT